jgi:predicted anti-sigma-YlaC factor YlaD
MAELEEHLMTCSSCQTEWQKLSALDQLFRSAPMVATPRHLHARVTARISRREDARRAIVGGLALAMGAVTLAMLTLVPIALGLLGNLGVAQTLLFGGVETITQVLSLVDTVSQVVFVLLDQFAFQFVLLSLGSFVIAIALNGLWIAAMRRLQVVSR